MSLILPSRRTAPQPRSAAIVHREQAALYTRRYVPRGSIPDSLQAGYLRAAALLRLQHPAPQSDFNVQSDSLCRRSRWTLAAWVRAGKRKTLYVFQSGLQQHTKVPFSERPVRGAGRFRRFFVAGLRRTAADFGKLRGTAAHFGRNCRGLWQGVWRISANGAEVDFGK
jgi:hypothetical protein